MPLTLKPAYLSKIEEHGGFTVWDGDRRMGVVR
jgi:hypothetical protein